MASKPFNQRLKDAIASGSSAIVATMIREAEKTSTAASKAADEAKARALDPLIDDAALAAAREAAEDATFTMERMAQAVTVLRAKREEFRENEDQAERQKIYDAALARRNAAADRLAAEYPGLANALGALLAEVAADRVVEQANRNLPRNGDKIAPVEQHARPGFTSTTHPLVRLHIPALSPSARHVMIWGSGGSLGAPRVFNPEITNAEEAHLTPEPRPRPARSPDATPSPVGHSKQGEAA